MIGYARMMLHRLSNRACHARMREHLALERLPHEELRQRQFWVAVTLLRHAYETVPHYRALMDRAGVHPDGVRSFAEFAALPVLRRWPADGPAPDLASKSLPRKVLAALQGQSAQGGGCAPSPILRDRVARDETQANWLLCLTFAGWTQADMVVRVYNAAGDGAGDLLHPGMREWLAGTLAVDACTYDPETVAHWVKAIGRCGRAYVLGSARVMADMAVAMRQRDIRLGNVRGAVVSGRWRDHGAGELSQHIAAAFGCPVLNLNGCAEVPCIAMQCSAGNLHLLTHSAYVEFEPDAACGPPRLIVTDLNNRAMPVLRFETGDHGVPVDGPCPCGRGFPLMRLVAPVGTWFQTAEGRFVFGGGLAQGLAARLQKRFGIRPAPCGNVQPTAHAVRHLAGQQTGQLAGCPAGCLGGQLAGHDGMLPGAEAAPHLTAWPTFRQVTPGVVSVMPPAGCDVDVAVFEAFMHETMHEAVCDAMQEATQQVLDESPSPWGVAGQVSHSTPACTAGPGGVAGLNDLSALAKLRFVPGDAASGSRAPQGEGRQ